LETGQGQRHASCRPRERDNPEEATFVDELQSDVADALGLKGGHRRVPARSVGVGFDRFVGHVDHHPERSRAEVGLLAGSDRCAHGGMADARPGGHLVEGGVVGLLADLARLPVGAVVALGRDGRQLRAEVRAGRGDVTQQVVADPQVVAPAATSPFTMDCSAALRAALSGLISSELLISKNTSSGGRLGTVRR
jgi:hypothetical protein